MVVFRYPLDESEDFIKRVIGLPGDEIRVEGRRVLLKRPGDAAFEKLERKVLKERCHEIAAQISQTEATTLEGVHAKMRFAMQSDCFENDVVRSVAWEDHGDEWFRQYLAKADAAFDAMFASEEARRSEQARKAANARWAKRGLERLAEEART